MSGETGDEDAQLWEAIGVWCSLGSVGYELDVVREDHQGFKEDFSKKAVVISRIEHRTRIV